VFFIENEESNALEMKKSINRKVDTLFVNGGVDGARTRDFQRDRLAL
jgi:hypothetical protein